MQNVMTVWSGLDTRKRLTVVLATVAIFGSVLWLSRLAAQPQMELLYAGLEPAAAGEVISALDQQGATYEVRGDAIYAAAGARDSLRMALASQGLPANGTAGYELLDGLSGFGTTSQMFDAAYWRAKEGELARTISASPKIRNARVHIANPSSEPFRRDAAPTASVFVTAAGTALNAEQAEALKYLVASAVTRLDPDAVSVIDSGTGTVIDGIEERAPGAVDGERAAALERSVERLLEARVGPGNAIVEVSLEPETDRESIVERRFDPDGRVAISTETEESSSNASGPAGGDVTVASNLPDGDAEGGGGERTSQDTQTRELTNYEVSETQREILREPGGIRRMTVAVLVDGTTETQADGTEVWQPRSDAELEDLRELVASAVGYDEARGDRITIKSLALQQVPQTETGSAPTSAWPVDPMLLARLGALAAVALALGLFVVRPILTGKGQPQGLPAPADGAAPEAISGEIDDGAFPGPEMNTVDDFDMDFSQGGGLPSLDGAEADPVTRLKTLIDERQDETMEILRGWMNETERA